MKRSVTEKLNGILRLAEARDFGSVNFQLNTIADQVRSLIEDVALQDQTAAAGDRLCAERGNDFWGECPDQPRSDWRYQVANGDTSLGYWEWAAARLESEEIESDPVEAQANEDECCEALVEAGWRKAGAAEMAAGSMLFRHDATGRQIDASTWYGLSKALLAEV